MDVSSLNIVFPKTIEILHEKKISYLQEQFRKTLHEQILVSTDSDIPRWFPVFLKFQGIRPEILEVAEFEYLRHLVIQQEAAALRMDHGQLGLNSTLQFVELHHAQPKLNRERGLYCFFKKQEQLIEYKLSIQQALVVDLLHDERKYSLEQLALHAATHEMGRIQSLQKWKETVFEMLQLGILVSQLKGNEA